MFHQPTIPDSQKPDKGPVTEYWAHSGAAGPWTAGPVIRVASIDPALKNFALRVEDRDVATGEVKTLVFTRKTLGQEFPAAQVELIKLLNLFKSVLVDCHFVVMERQLPYNYRAVRISQVALTWFMIFCMDNEPLTRIYEVAPQLKSDMLPAPPKLSAREVKTWSKQEAIKILTLRRDTVALAELKGARKTDDLADTVCQIEAFFIHQKLPTRIIC